MTNWLESYWNLQKKKKMTFKQDKDNRVSSSRWQLSTCICHPSFGKPQYNDHKGIQKGTNERVQLPNDKKQREKCGQEMRQKKSWSRRCSKGSHRRDGSHPSWQNSVEDSVHQGFRSLNTIDIWSQIVLCCEGLSYTL